MDTMAMIFLFSMAIWSYVNCCSLPLGWKSKTLPDLVKEAKLIIYGEFSSVTNSTNPQNPQQMDVRIQTTVHCVLRNDDNIDVSSSIVIEDYEHPFDGRCHNNLVNLHTGVRVAVFLQKSGGNYAFKNYNVQSAWHEVNDSLLAEVMKRCAVQNAELPSGHAGTGITCPALNVTQDSCVQSSGGKITRTSLLTIILLSTLRLFFM